MEKNKIIVIMLLLLFLFANVSVAATTWTSLDFGGKATTTEPSLGWTSLSFGGKAAVQVYTWSDWSGYWNFTYANSGSTPTQTNPSPSNSSVGIDLTPTLRITVNDTDIFDTLDVTWSSNSSGSWLPFGTNNSIDISGGAVTIYQPNSNLSVWNTTYYWRIAVTDGINTSTETYHFRTLSEGDQLAPSVTTNATTPINSTNATLNGYLDDDGYAGAGCNVWFSYGLTTAYGTNTTNQTSVYSGSVFNETTGAINPGALYHCRAVANNSNNTVYGDDVVFLTKPAATTNLVVSNGYSPDTLNLSWTKGTGANNTYIERDSTASWDRGEGTLVYNNTGSSYGDSGLTMNTLYYYQVWSYTTWIYDGTSYYQYGSYASGSNTTDNVDPPYGGNSSYAHPYLNLTWIRGNNSDREIVVRNNNTWSTSPTDGWVAQNDTVTWFNTSITSTGYFTIWSYNDTSGLYSATGLNIVWGVMNINVYDENSPWIPVTTYDLLITNEAGTETYYATELSNSVTIFYEDMPYGINTIVQISHDDYETRNTYIDLYLNTYNDFTFYLTPTEILVPPDEEGEEDCIIRSFIDSLSISTFTEDLLINLTHTLEDLIQVEIYNGSLFGSYGGWIVVANDYINYNTTRVIINQSIIDINSSMARISYYYESCDPTYTPSGLYYIRIVESYVTSFGVTDLSIEDAKVTFQKYMNTTDRYENISTLFTDTNGFVNLYLIPASLYRVVIEKSGYQTKTVSYQPAPPNDFGQTTEKVFRIERTDTDSDSDLEIPNETVVVVPYNTTAFEIYYLNLNNDNLYVNFSIYDGGTLIFTYNETTDPDEIWLYFNFSNYTLNNDILTLIVNATKSNISFVIHVQYFSITQATRLTGPTLAPIAAIISICLCMFGLTLVHPKKVFGVFGMIVLLIAIAVTAFAPQIWYLHLIQAIEIILLIVVILTFKEEGIHAV